MKKRILLLLLFLFVVSIPVKAADIKEKLSQIGFHLIVNKDERVEIAKLFERQQKYANRKNDKKIREMFDPEFVDYDGLDLNEYINSFKESWALYKNLEYKTTVNSITVNGNYATVETVDTVQGNTKAPYDVKLSGSGTFQVESKSYNYLKKIDGEWKISSAVILSETSSLKYGSAKEIPIKITAPECVKAGEQYNAILSVDVPEKSAVIASIVSEPVVFPQKSSAMSMDIFRSVKQSGELERVLTANENGLNEEAMGCLSIAKATVNSENGQMNISIDGVAFVSSRVNVVPQRNIVNERKKENR